MGAAGLILASCSNEDLVSNVAGSDEATVTINLSTPQISTRDYSDGQTAKNLEYAVYKITTANDGTKTYKHMGDLDGTATMNNLKQQVNFKLVTGHTYALVFWAGSDDAPYTVKFDDNEATMTIGYTDNNVPVVTANMESLDGFFKTEEIEVNGDITKEIVLTRPFAQINVGTSDLAAAESAGYVPEESHITVKKVYSQLDLISGKVLGDPEDYDFVYEAIPSEDEVFPVDGGYNYLAMVYALVNYDQNQTNDKDLYQTVEVVFDVIDKDGEKAAENTVGSVPVKRNHRTNIYGELLTSNVIVNVRIDPIYDTPDYEPNSIVLAAAIGGTINLTEETTVADDFVMFNKDGILNLNGQTLNLENTSLSIESGANVVINGDGEVKKTGADIYENTAPVYVYGGTVTINGGTFTSDGVAAIYVEKGTAIINGGYFACDNQYSNKWFTLNCLDAAYKNGSAKIIVYGGIFENFDPANSYGEPNAPVSFLADGYKSVPTTIDGKTCYVVVPEEVDAVVTSLDELKDALDNGQNVAMLESIDVPVNSAYGFNFSEGEIDGQGNTINFQRNYKDEIHGFQMSGGSLKNLTVTGADRAIYFSQIKEDIYLDNLILGGVGTKVMYPINTGTNNGQYGVYISNSELYGWASWAQLKEAKFTNCKFGKGNYYGDVNPIKYDWEVLYNCAICPYVDTLFENCEFDEDCYVDLSKFMPNATLTFKNCTVNGTVLTEENHKIMKGYLLDDLNDWENYDNVKDQIKFVK